MNKFVVLLIIVAALAVAVGGYELMVKKSAPVPQPPQIITLRGTYVMGVECPGVQADDGKFYTLEGDFREPLKIGDVISIEGIISSENKASFCMQGTGIKVSKILISSSTEIPSTFKFISTDKVLSLEILSPKGGEAWPLGSVQTIRWTGGNQNNVKIVLEVHSYGASEAVITTGIPNTGSYTWQIPTNLILTDTNLIRIEQASSNPNLGGIKVKSNYFSIEGERK